MSEVEIQCPECGKIFTKAQGYDELYCSRCKKFYSEHEIREKCGI